jgi:cytochrome b561
MANEELLNLIIVNIPNFVGFMVGILLLYRIAWRLLEQNKDLQQQCIDCHKPSQDS